MSIRVGLRHMARSAIYRPAAYDAFRKSHEIDGTAVGEQTDYQVEIKAYYADPWKREASNPILQKGAGGEWDDTAINFPYVLKVGDTYYLYYSGYGGTNNCTGLATGNDGKNFTKINTGIGGTSKVLDVGAGGEWDDRYAWGACIVYCPDKTPKWYMFYTGMDAATTKEDIGLATSNDGINWIKDGGNPILSHGGTGWREHHLCHPDVKWDEENSRWVMLVSGAADPWPAVHETIGRYYCTDENFPDTWTEDPGNPVIDYGDQAGVDDYHAYHPKIYPSKVNGLWYVFYTARTAYAAGATICRATTGSLYDGAFTKYPDNPVVRPQAANAWEATQVLMPHCALKIGDDYYMYYLGEPQLSIGIVLSENIESGIDIAGSSLAADEVSLNGKCRTDFGDIRFRQGVTELDYWIEEKVDGNYATIWVEVGTIPADPDSATIYIYYGKADATSESDGDATFLFFDDFNDNSINTDKWDIEKKGSASAVVEEVGEQLHLAGENGVSSSGNLVSKTFTITHSFQIIMKRKGTTNYYRHTAIGYGTITGEGGVNWWSTVFNDGYQTFAGGVAALGQLSRWDAGASTVIVAGGAISAGDNTWYDEIISYDENGALTWYTTGGARGPVVDTDHKDDAKKVLLTQGEHGPTSNGGDSYFDYIRIRKYVSTEPTHGAWGAEEAVVWPF